MFLLVGLVLVFFVPSPWNVVALLAVWHCSSANSPSGTGRCAAIASVGAETLIGQAATVITACQPSGQVRLRGETWDARCDEGANSGDEVVVRARDGLTLVVERA